MLARRRRPRIPIWWVEFGLSIQGGSCRCATTRRRTGRSPLRVGCRQPGWSPDPSWPPPPPGWRLWVDDDAPSPQGAKAALSRLERTGDDVEYFGDDRAWSEDSGQTPADDQLNAAVPALPPRPTEVAPEDLSVHHLGHYATIRWDEQKYVIGKIVAVSADSAAINVAARRSRHARFLSARPGGRRPRQTHFSTCGFETALAGKVTIRHPKPRCAQNG